MIHPNGRGHVEDEAEARPLAFVDPGSRICDRARAHSGRLINSTLAIEARLHNADVINSLVACDEVTGGKIVECQLFDQVCVWDSPFLYRVQATNGVRVYGSSVLLGPMRLYGDMRIIAGTWHRAPLYRHLGFCFMTEGPPGWALVDCKFMTYVDWFRVGPRFAKRHYDWSDAQIERVRQVLLEWQRGEDLKLKHWGQCVVGCGYQ